MRILGPVVGVLLSGLMVSTAGAAVPNSITSLLGPSIGYLQAQSDLCGWSLDDKIHAAYQKGFAQIGMTEAQQSAAWEQAEARKTKLMGLSKEVKDGMKIGLCTPAKRAEVEQQLAD